MSRIPFLNAMKGVSAVRGDEWAKTGSPVEVVEVEEGAHVERVQVMLGSHVSFGVGRRAVRVVVGLSVAVGGGEGREGGEGDKEGREHGGRR